MTADGSVDAYLRSLETQVENKQYFLNQANETIKNLSKADKSQNLQNDGKFRELMKKPMVFTERSDPLGVSLVSTSLRLRKDSSNDWISLNTEYNKNIRSMIETQKKVNRDLEVLVNLFEKGSTGKGTSLAVRPSLVEENNALWARLETMLKETLFKQGNHVESVYSLFKRLVKSDPSVRQQDFQESDDSKKMFRLLLKADLIEIDETSDTVRLINFTDDGF
ncbi:hypothetical protein KAFR_0E04360 [Kazachstania africana CBS 2517]|uniref:Uncharacterized protein n=1 Tax=Kazachstania africana (strain ATCC 22294 / BCRC 22015 / CBS 2517 / CECT 1963 / NBRC 1671 / NRRL Y-8276) TaxID=1071382 RepID=H2AW36_KAZAF|nr:hypothetical protein KAFR_0E04360 [Kazachstania africana CBS 2517]CCF58586.1 hypothetical protein KAFR_0E04360 [Kazachstania africana CBS 2517]